MAIFSGNGRLDAAKVEVAANNGQSNGIVFVEIGITIVLKAAAVLFEQPVDRKVAAG